MIYTCYEMVRDCRAGLPQGWTYFLANYLPAIRRVIARYSPAQAGNTILLERVLLDVRKPGSSLFQSLEPAPERWFLAELRQSVIAHLDAPPAEIDLDLEAAGQALAPLTVTEKQAAWLETMHYTPEETAPMLRVSAATVEKIRARAAELIRGQVDAWRRTLLAENGAALGQAAAAAHTADCYPRKAFLDIIDGRTTWLGREQTDRHLNACWHCVDHFCRMLEVAELMRGSRPLEEAELAPLRRLLGLPDEKRAGWRRLFGGA